MPNSPDPAAPYRDLIAAIRDALDVPRPASLVNDGQTFEWLQRDRALAVHAIADAVLDDDRADEGIVKSATDVLRDRIRQLPITYRPYEPAQPEGGNHRFPPPELQVAPASTSAEAADVR